MLGVEGGGEAGRGCERLALVPVIVVVVVVVLGPLTVGVSGLVMLLLY